MILLFLVGCERDPSLFGYWDIVRMRAGPTAEEAEEVDRAGFLEFSPGSAIGTFSYTWEGGWAPDPTPDLVTFGTDALESTDFIETYKSKGETYTVSMTTGYEETNTFDLVDWKGSSVTLESADAALPGGWGTDGGTRGHFALDLER